MDLHDRTELPYGISVASEDAGQLGNAWLQLRDDVRAIDLDNRPYGEVF
ncbi:MAG: hypothetical protein JNK90_02775 [Planctomycetaceae bacterium]|nr:hypothetical protein [Planctomycetaceae bacterium]